ncbi:thioesterase-like superfamily-domain-containing protein [Amylocarpus encephaloides]|uniref:Thioesterase-like superfamily-domain-containing protein n=1 Tax=Amylocarpus encephaloides TaxID=45428 RepID=A0A9P7YGR4_9HELO|nr:thioesterase-like superfamily-domain-containing protein [Amylocarpus encephaloides]
MNPTPLPKALGRGIKLIKKGEYDLEMPNSFSFGPTIKDYFEAEHVEVKQTDVYGIQWQYFRLVFSGTVKFVIMDVHIGRSSSTILAIVSQKGKDCMMGFLNMTNMALPNGLSFDTEWRFNSPPIAASVSLLVKDSDPKWVSYQCPYHPESFRRAQSYLKFFIPLEMQESRIRDHWITPSDPVTTFTNEALGFVVDISLPILDNFYPDKSIGSQAATIKAGLEQKREREVGITKVVDISSGAYYAPAFLSTLATTVEIKKRLPPGGVKWLFMRSEAKEIKNGRMSMEVAVYDEHMDLVALSQQLNLVIDISRAMANKQKL